MLGMHEMTVQSYELGYRHPKQDQIKRVVEALDIDPAFLQPSKLDTNNAILALIFDLMEQYGDVIFSEGECGIFIGLDKLENPKENQLLKMAFEAHENMTPEQFKIWLIDASSP